MSARRPARSRGGQVIILTAIIITIVVLSLVSLVSQTVNLHQNLRYEPYKEVTEDLAASFRSALAFALANMTAHYDATGDDVGARADAFRYLSKWKEAAMRAYADLGLQVDFVTPLGVNSSYVLQGPKTITYLGNEEYIDAWAIYNLSQLYWDQSMGCSAAYATLCINLTEYGFYGWKKDIIVASNATLYPDSLTGTAGRSPGDVVLVLDCSGSMLWQNLTSLADPDDDQNDHLLHVSGTIGPNSGWKTVGSFNVGEIPTQFAAVLNLDRSDLEFRLVNGSYNVQLVVTYDNGSDYTKILPVIADASVRSRYPNNNYGTNQSLEVCGYDPPGSYTDYYRVWLKFNISSIPSLATVESAILTVYVQSQLSANGRTYYLHHSDTDSWIESGSGSIRWNNQPSYSSSHVDARAPSRGLMMWDVTADVQNDYAGNKLCTWVIKDPSEGSSTKRYIVMYSKEAGGITGYNLLPSSSLPFYPGPGKRVVWSTNDGRQLPHYGWVFGRSDMWFYGKNGTWSIQLRNTHASSSRNYVVDVYARKLDEAKNAATTFLRLLNPNLDRLAIVQYGAGSSRSDGQYYYAANVSLGSDGSYFYDLNDAVDFQKAIDDISWRTPYGGTPALIGYGFERITGTVRAGGVTPLGAGEEVGNRLFNRTLGARENSQRILILITDGRENVEPDPDYFNGWKGEAPPGGRGVFGEPCYYSIDSRLPEDAYIASNVTTYTIGFGVDVNEYALMELAQQGHGEYYFAANGTQLAQILAKLAYGMNDKVNFHFSLMQEHGAGINVLSSSDLIVYFTDPLTHERHIVDPSFFRYEGGGNFVVTASFAGWETPEAVDIVVRDPRGILVRIHVPLAYWGA